MPTGWDEAGATWDAAAAQWDPPTGAALGAVLVTHIERTVESRVVTTTVIRTSARPRTDRTVGRPGA